MVANEVICQCLGKIMSDKFIKPNVAKLSKSLNLPEWVINLGIITSGIVIIGGSVYIEKKFTESIKNAKTSGFKEGLKLSKKEFSKGFNAGYSKSKRDCLSKLEKLKSEFYELGKLDGIKIGESIAIENSITESYDDYLNDYYSQDEFYKELFDCDEIYELDNYWDDKIYD